MMINLASKMTMKEKHLSTDVWHIEKIKKKKNEINVGLTVE